MQAKEDGQVPSLLGVHACMCSRFSMGVGHREWCGMVFFVACRSCRQQLICRAVTWLANRGQQEVMRKKLQGSWLQVLPQAVHFKATLVIDVHILLLCSCKKHFVVQESDITCGLSYL